jgi:carboxyl-terminal processing protease
MSYLDRMKQLRYFCLLFFVVASGRAESMLPSPAVRKYVEEVVGILQANFVNRAAINWVAFKQKLLAKASGANTTEEAYPAAEFALAALGDKHT